MIARTQSYALSGLEGVPVTVETDISRGLPSFDMVGLPDTAVKESKERVKSAIKNSVMIIIATRFIRYFAISASPPKTHIYNHTLLTHKIQSQ